MYPTALAANIAPIAPAILVNPTTLATAARGNMSDTSVYRLADQPWCAPAAIATAVTANQRCVVEEANTTGVTASAQISNAALRLLLRVHPCLSKVDEIQPPPMLP